MKWLTFVAVCLCVTLLGGCAVLDALFGTNPQGTAEPSLLQTIVGGVLNSWVPGSGAVLTGLGGIYAAFRARQWKKALVATAGTIEQFGDLPKVELKEKLAASHVEAGVADMMKKVCVKFDVAAEVKPPAT
jgi:hypothetical protein